MPAPRTEEQALLYIEPLIPLLETGLSLQHSCNMAKINEKSVYNYMDKFPSVYSRIRTAKSTVIANSADTIGRAAKKDPKYALEVLKRKDRQEWGDNVDVTSKGEKVVPILGGITQEDDVQEDTSD